jgi:RNA polymerase sigma-70 factor (ECF subfamily)
MSDKHPTLEEKQDLFHRLLFRNQNRIYAYVLTLIGNYTDADDVMQETISVMWQKFTDFKAGTNFVSWGISISHYKILDYRRNKQKNGKLCQYNNDLLEQFGSEVIKHNVLFDEKFALLRNCIEKLKGQYITVVKLRFQEDLNTTAISNRCGISVANVYQILSRAYSMLISCMNRQKLHETQEGI